MTPEISEQFRFEHLLAHTFPGFFSAITLFMLLDVLSPRDLTLWAFNNIEGVVGFIGFVILIGTILGVIIDGLHHMIIERFFDRFIENKKNSEFIKALYPQTDLMLRRPYFFKKNGFMKIDEYITNKIYRYSECYVNTFISLIPFSFIIPIYLSNVLQIPWNYSMLIAGISFIIAFAMLYNGYIENRKYDRWVYSAICSYLKCEYYIHLSAEAISGDRNFELKAEIFKNESQLRVLKGGIKVNFKPSENIAPKNNGETDDNGIARATLTNNNKGKVAIVTATSKKCIPGITTVRFQERV